jgi:hypothetical protein
LSLSSIISTVENRISTVVLGWRKKPVVFDHRFDAMSLKDLLFVVNCALPEHEKIPSYDAFLNRIAWKEPGTPVTPATPLQTEAMTRILGERAGAAYDLRQANLILSERLYIEIAESNRKSRLLDSWTYRWNRAFVALVLCATILLGVYRTWAPVLDIVAAKMGAEASGTIIRLSRENADLRVQLQISLNELDKASQRIERLEKQLGVFDGNVETKEDKTQ